VNDYLKPDGELPNRIEIGVGLPQRLYAIRHAVIIASDIRGHRGATSVKSSFPDEDDTHLPSATRGRRAISEGLHRDFKVQNCAGR